jgi:hypothetical protein
LKKSLFAISSENIVAKAKKQRNCGQNKKPKITERAEWFNVAFLGEKKTILTKDTIVP